MPFTAAETKQARDLFGELSFHLRDAEQIECLRGVWIKRINSYTVELTRKGSRRPETILVDAITPHHFIHGWLIRKGQHSELLLSRNLGELEPAEYQLLLRCVMEATAQPPQA